MVEQTELKSIESTPNILFKKSTNVGPEAIDQVFDSHWVRTTFLIPDSDFNATPEEGDYVKWIIKNRYRTSADRKFTGTAPGMNLAVNARPQFTWYSDIRSKGRISSRPDVTLDQQSHDLGIGMGHYYSEAFDDNAQRLYLRFGVPQYTPITAWLTNVFDIKRAALMNRGIVTRSMFTVTSEIAEIAGTIIGIASAPLVGLSLFAFNILSAITNNSSSRFISLRPTMHNYWLMVEDIVNRLVSRRTLVPHLFPEYTYATSNFQGEARSVTKDYITRLIENGGGIFDSKGRVSVFAIALRAQRAFNQVMYEDYKRNHMDEGANYQPETVSQDFLDRPIQPDGEGNTTYFTTESGKADVVSKFFVAAHDLLIPTEEGGASDALDNADEQGFTLEEGGENQDNNTEFSKTRVSSMALFAPQFMDEQGLPIEVDDPKNFEDKVTENIDANSDRFDRFKEYLLAELSNGLAFVCFNVNSTGSVGESFTNSASEHPLDSAVNGISSSARRLMNTYMPLASTIDQIPVVGDAVAGIASTVSSAISGATFGLTNPLFAILYGSKIEFPKVWDSSTTQFPNSSYSATLFSPYGNPFSQLFNIYLPLSMLMAGTLPRGTGSQSYAPPFMCQVYDRGRVQVTLGMVSNLTVTRGTSNLPFTRKGQANSVDVSFEIENLDSIMFAETIPSGLTGALSTIFKPGQNDTPFTDYLSVLAGLDVYNQIYLGPRLRLRLSEAYLSINRYIDPDPAYFASLTAGTFDALTFGISRRVMDRNVNVNAPGGPGPGG